MNLRLFWITLVLLGSLLLASCGSEARVGALRSESQTVELGDAEAVRVDIGFGSGDLVLTGGAEELLEADFAYNVASLRPEVDYTDGALVIRQPETKGLPILRDITDFRNEWGLRLCSDVPMNLNVDVGAGTSNLQLGGLSLTQLNVSLGAGKSMVDLSGDWAHDLEITIDTGAADISLLLPKDVGTRVVVDAGASLVEVQGLLKDGNVYTNNAYGVSEITMLVNMEAGIGRINLEVEE